MRKWYLLALPLALLGGCAKKKPVAQNTPAAPQSAPAPTASAAAPAATPRAAAPARETPATRQANDDGIRKALGTINSVLAYFDFDKYTLRQEAVSTLTDAAGVIKQAMQDDGAIRLNIEGHADERGSAEYNLALGDRRAQQVKEFLAQLGLPGDRMKTVSLGEERPQCTESNEDCWQKNRRARVDYTRN